MARSARPVFNGAPTDDLEAVDVYGQVDTQTRNNFSSAYSAFGESLESSLNRQRSRVNGLLTDISRRYTNPATAAERIQGLLSGSKGEIRRLREDVQTRLYESVGGDIAAAAGYDPDQVQKARVSIEGVYRTVQDADINTVKGTVAMLQDVTGSDAVKMLDIGAEVGLLSTTLEEISRWRLPELTDKVLENVDDDATRRMVVKSASRRLAESASVEEIAAYLKYVDAAALTADRPDFPMRLIQRYTLPSDATPGDYPDLVAEFAGVMDQLMPTWFYTPRGETDVINLAVLENASRDAKTLLSSDPTYRTPVLIAENYPERSVERLLTDMYPLIPIVQ